MDGDQYAMLRADIKELHGKLDAALEQEHTNTNDIVWLKKGLLGAFGLLGTWIGSHLYLKLGG